MATDTPLSIEATMDLIRAGATPADADPAPAEQPAPTEEVEQQRSGARYASRGPAPDVEVEEPAEELRRLKQRHQTMSRQ